MDKQTPDSSCSATAYLCGVKANFLTTGVNANVKMGDCSAAKDPANRVYSLAYHAQQASKSTGIVTTVTVTHASPAGVFGHTANRFWECDGDVVRMGADPSQCEDLAAQLITGETGKNLDVILGGGRTKFFPQNQKDSDGNVGERLDNINLIAEWRRRHQNGRVVFSKEALNKINYGSTDALLGLFTPNYMAYNVDADRAKEPSLTEMTLAAIKVLEKNPKGYFLFIEGGKIDIGSHANLAHIALDETNELSKAIEAALEHVDLDETLVVATADHSHSLTISGFADRGQNILGSMDSLVQGGSFSELDDQNGGNPYSILNYATGPGFQSLIDANGRRVNLGDKDMSKVSAFRFLIFWYNVYFLRIRSKPSLPISSSLQHIVRIARW